MKNILFRPCTSVLCKTKNGERPCVSIYERCTYTKTGYGIIGHCSLDAAMSIHKDWEFMDYKEYKAVDDDWEKRKKELGL